MRRSSSDPSLNRRPDELPAASGDTYADPAYVELKCWEAAKDAVAACAEDTAGQTYAYTLYKYPGATLDDLHEAVTTLEELERIARRVLGGQHPLMVLIENRLRNARTRLRFRAGSVKSVCEAIGAMTAGDV